MAHNHSHNNTTTNLKIAFWLNLAFTLLEIFGGLWTNSMAILADALHDLGDSLSLGVAWYLGEYAQKESDQRYSYGYGRFSLLGALVNAIVLVGGSLFILSKTLPRLFQPEPTSGAGMIGFALIGIIINGVAALRLRGERSMNARLVAWHLLEDVLGWVAVLIVGITLLFVEIYILDPILSILITLYVLYHVISNLRETLQLFLQAAPPEVDLADIDRRLAAIEGVQSTHHTHMWSLDGERHVLSTHLLVDSAAAKADVTRIKCAAKEICADLALDHLTIEIEYEDEDCHLRETI